jgi:TetR/AcrR family transcriptional regulator
VARPRGRPAAGAVDAGPGDGALLDAALRSFADRGYDGTSVRELARDLGVSHNLIPQRFGSKDQLWYAAVEHGFGSLFTDMLTVLEDPSDDPLERLQAMVVRFIEANAANPSLLRIINHEAANPGPRLDHLFDAYIGPVQTFGQVLLDELHAAGRIRTTDVGLVYFLMMNGAGGPLALPALAERFGGPVLDPHEHAVAAVELLFEGLRR